MTDTKKPRINVTRGAKRPSPRKAPPEHQPTQTGWWDQMHNVWLAGLGVLSVVEEQSTKLFRALVEEGKRWEQTRREEAAQAGRSTDTSGESQA